MPVSPDEAPEPPPFCAKCGSGSESSGVPKKVWLPEGFRVHAQPSSLHKAP